MRVTVVHYSDSASLRIEIDNRGGASIAVSAIFIWTEWADAGRLSSGLQIRRDVGTKEGRMTGVKGTLPPVTLKARHSEFWVIKPKLLTELREVSQDERIVIEALLAGGKSVRHEMAWDDIY